MLRNDFTGLPTAELIIEAAGAPSLLAALLDAGRPSGIARIDHDVAETLRIEAGIPASLAEIDENVIPPETGQIERGISYHKGCYLGQEVIERMRSHGVIARKLVGIKLAPDAQIACPAPVKVADAEAGRLTSLTWSFALDAPLGLGYLKAVHAKTGQLVSVAEVNTGEVVQLPAR
jgi:folate-binding protein YgfZ